MKKARYNELKRILEERRTEMLLELHDKMRDVRKENATVPQQGVRDEAESSEADIQEDIEFALLQIKAETLKKIGDALLLLDNDAFGECYECGDEISAQRLRALRYGVNTVKRNASLKHQLIRRMAYLGARYHCSWTIPTDNAQHLAP